MVNHFQVSGLFTNVIPCILFQPEHYISHLIGHEGPGSLHSVLREKGLCNSLTAGLSHTAPGFGFFTVTVDMTEKAMDCVDEIITLLFQVGFL